MSAQRMSRKCPRPVLLESAAARAYPRAASIWAPFTFVWREWPRACGFVLGVIVTASVMYAMLILVVIQLIEAVGKATRL